MVFVTEDDPAVVAAIAQAQETLPIFWRLHQASPPGYSEFAVKVGLPTVSRNGEEHIWVFDVVREPGGGRGTLANLPDDLRAVGRTATSVFIDKEHTLAWQRILNTRGWVAPHWPKEHGGTGWDEMQRYIFASECALAGAPG
ncbi:MAG: hypothetical protein B7Z13_07220, partial [Caulobacterales bacterium 32-67-6]